MIQDVVISVHVTFSFSSKKYISGTFCLYWWRKCWRYSIQSFWLRLRLQGNGKRECFLGICPSVTFYVIVFISILILVINNKAQKEYSLKSTGFWVHFYIIFTLHSVKAFPFISRNLLDSKISYYKANIASSSANTAKWKYNRACSRESWWLEWQKEHTSDHSFLSVRS